MTLNQDAIHTTGTDAPAPAPAPAPRALTASDIDAAKDIEIVKVHVPEWGGVVYIKTLSGADRDFFTNTVSSGGQLYQTQVLSRSLCDKDGVRLFNDTTVLDKRSSSVIGRLFQIAIEVSGLGEEIEEAEKNG